MICGASSALQTGSIVLCADTLITYIAEDGTPASSNPLGGKLFDLPLGFYAAISGDIAQCNRVVGYLHQQMSMIPPDRSDRVGLLEKAISETTEYVLCSTRQEVLGDYGVSLADFLHDEDLVDRYRIQDDIKRGVARSNLILAGFNTKGSPILLSADFTTSLRPDTRFICGGSGGQAALDWLNMREQNVFMSVPRTVYHVHEAKRFAEQSPVVGKRSHVLVATRSADGKRRHRHAAYSRLADGAHAQKDWRSRPASGLDGFRADVWNQGLDQFFGRPHVIC